MNNSVAVPVLTTLGVLGLGGILYLFWLRQQQTADQIQNTLTKIKTDEQNAQMTAQSVSNQVFIPEEQYITPVYTDIWPYGGWYDGYYGSYGTYGWNPSWRRSVRGWGNWARAHGGGRRHGGGGGGGRRGGGGRGRR